MSSFFKFLGFAVAAVVLLLVAAVAIFVVTFDANALKGQIITAVKEETGRELAIDGEVGLTFFPSLGFSLGPTRLGDAPGFGSEPFLAFEAASASVRLVPLFSGSIDVGELRLIGLRLKAVTGADGRNNWDDLAELGEAGDEAPAGGPSDGGDFDLGAVQIGGIVFRDATLSYEDRGAGTKYAIRDWNLNTGTFRLGQPVAIDTSMNLQATNPDLDGRLEAKGTLTPDADRLVMANPDLALGLSGAGLESLTGVDLEVGANRLALDAAGPFELESPKIRLRAESADFGEPLEARVTATALTGNLEAQTLKLSSLEATAWGMTMTGEVSGTKISSAPALSGSIAIAEFSPKEVAARAGAPLSPTADPKALTRATLQAKFATTPNSARFDDLELRLDDTRFTGNLAVVDLAKQALRFTLAADELVLDRYLAPASEVPAAQTSGDEVAIPAEDIRALDVDGTLKVGRLLFAGLTSTNVEMGLKAGGGTLRIFPSRADMYGGRYEGDIRIDASGEVPKLSIDERLEDVDFGALSADVFDNQQLTGALKGRVTLTGIGATQSALEKTLTGDAAFQFLDGAFLGVDIPFELQRATALFNKRPPPSGGGSGRTEFAELSGTAKVTNGVLQNDDLVARLPFMLGSGSGTVNLADDTLRYRLDMQFQKSPTLPDAASDLIGFTFPVIVGGTLGKPSLDVGDMAAAMARQRVEKEVDKVKDRVLGRANEELGKLLGGGRGGDASQATDAGDAAPAEGEGAAAEEEAKPAELLEGAFRGLLKRGKDDEKKKEGDNRR